MIYFAACNRSVMRIELVPKFPENFITTADYRGLLLKEGNARMFK